MSTDGPVGRNIETILPLTPMQQGVLYHTLESAKKGVYFGQFSCDLEGPLQADLLRQSWTHVMARHAALRTLFTWERRDKPLQIVRKFVATAFQFHDWRDQDGADQLLAWQQLCEEEKSTGFELGAAPLWRIVLVRVAEEKHRLLLCFHHIILDGWSTRLIFDDAMQHYGKLTNGVPTERRPAPSYAEFVNVLAKIQHASGLAFFKEMLQGYESAVFPRVREEHGDLGNGSGSVSRRVSATAAENIVRAARGARVTLNTLLVACWGELLQRYCDRDDVVFGTTVAGRAADLPGAEETVGLFINTLPLRVKSRDSESLPGWLQALQSKQTQINEFQQTPLQDVIRTSDVAKGQPLFESILVFENFPPQRDIDTGRLRVSQQRYEEFSHFPLAILVVPGREIELIAVFDKARLSARTAEMILVHLETLLNSMAAMLHGKGDTLEMLSAPEREELLVTRCNTDTQFASLQPAHEWVKAVAHEYPERIAIIDDGTELTFAGLERAANGVAADMIQRGIGRGTVVPILLERSAVAVIAMLGTLKSGAAYAPLDPNWPTARVQQTMSDLVNANRRHGRPTLLVTHEDTPTEALQTDEVLTAGEIGKASVHEGSPEVTVALSDPAYVMFTSGSTGAPKGVVVSHANLVNSTLARDRFYGDKPGAFLLLSSLATDSSVAGIYWSLFSGATLVLPRGREEQDVAAIHALIARHSVSHLLCVPSLYGLLLELGDAAQLASLAVAIVAGEACPPVLIDTHHEFIPHTLLVNEYGPSEATVWATAARLGPDQAVCIGRPIANTQAYVMDSAGRLLPDLVAGELFIGGANVADGYLNDADTTAGKFVADPFSRSDDARLYRTGDRAWWRRDGQLSYLGRTDNQIKVRGYRVEPEEIEAIIETYAEIAASAVLLDKSGRLVAYVVSDAVDADDLRQFVRSRMPDYMVPQRFLFLPQMPLTPAGKIDRSALLECEDSASNDSAPEEVVKPRTDEEKVLAGVWSRVLGIEDISVHDDFFELGGDSLLSIRILAQVGSAGLRISPVDFFAQPTIAGQARVAVQQSSGRAAAHADSSSVPLSPIQRWFFQRIGGAPSQWNLNRVFLLPESASLTVLQQAVAALAEHHDALRLQFELEDGVAKQYLGAVDVPRVTEHDSSSLSAAQLAAEIAEVASASGRDFAFSNTSLIQFVLIRTAADLADRLLVCCHHLVMDAYAFDILSEDLAAAMRAVGKGVTPALPPRTTPFSTWCRRLADDASHAVDAKIEEYWDSALAEAAPGIPRAADAGRNDEASVATVTVTLDVSASEQLVATGNRFRMPSRDVLLTALAMTLSDWTSRDSVTVDLEGHGRDPVFDNIDTSRTIGWMTSVFPISLRAVANDDAAKALVRTRDLLRRVPLNGISHGLLREYGDSATAKALRAAAPSQVCFNFLGDTSKRAGSDLVPERENCGECRSPDAVRAYLIDIDAAVTDGQLQVTWRYSRNVHQDETIKQLAAEFISKLQLLISGETAANTPALTPEDFPLAGLDQSALAEIENLLSEAKSAKSE